MQCMQDGQARTALTPAELDRVVGAGVAGRGNVTAGDGGVAFVLASSSALPGGPDLARTPQSPRTQNLAPFCNIVMISVRSVSRCCGQEVKIALLRVQYRPSGLRGRHHTTTAGSGSEAREPCV